jgi:hypothetical protein
VNAKKVKLTGVVIPIDWDEDGNTTAVALSTEAENVTLRAAKVLQKDLLGLIQKEVEISGILFTNGSNRTISVDRYILKKSLEQNTSS